MVPGRPWRRRDHRTDGRQPDGRLSVLEAHDGHHGRGHGRRRTGGQRRDGRRPRRARRAPGVPAGLGLRRGPGRPRGPARPVEVGSHGGGVRRRHGRCRRRGRPSRPLRPLLVLHELRRLRPRRPRPRSHPLPSRWAGDARAPDHRDRRAPLPRRAGQQLHDAFARHHGRAPASRARHHGRGQRRGDAHEQAHLRRLLDRARPARAAGRRRGGGCGRDGGAAGARVPRGAGHGGHLLGRPRPGGRTRVGRPGLRRPRPTAVERWPPAATPGSPIPRRWPRPSAPSSSAGRSRWPRPTGTPKPTCSNSS